MQLDSHSSLEAGVHLQVVEEIMQIQSDAPLQRPVLQCVQDGFPCLCLVIGDLVKHI